VLWLYRCSSRPCLATSTAAMDADADAGCFVRSQPCLLACCWSGWPGLELESRMDGWNDADAAAAGLRPWSWDFIACQVNGMLLVV
jgi:hypothetical protein